MRLSPEQWPTHLSRQVPPLTLLISSEPFLSLECQDHWRRACRAQNYEERKVWTVEARFSWAEVDLHWNSGSLFGSRSAVEIHIPSGKPGPEGIRQLEKLANAPQADKRLLILLSELDYRTRQAAWLSQLQTKALWTETQPVPRSALTRWIAQRLVPCQASAEALEFLADCTEGNLLATAQEIAKLSLLYPTGPLTLEQVQSAVMVMSRHTLTDLTRALSQGNGAQMLLLLRSLNQEGEALPLVLWSLSEDWRAAYLLCRTREEGRTPSPSTFKEARLWGERRPLLERFSQKTSSRACARALQGAAEVDQLIKGLGHGDPWETLGQVILDLFSQPPLH
ncbi:DNA polymerase III subunit delta [Ferrovum sp.]|jgi:DNA polymerase-3 subunit delta|uniref:DNA polymerase III subunit delta n=1 Tax=Ferrovum sp. TaxID=2609467 RepID=UPI00261BB51E|nr:DNA polymerase III subunit delta [Ferrovum sp.]